MNKLYLKYYLPIKNKLANGMICSICNKKGKYYLMPTKRSNSKNPLDINEYDEWNLTNGKLHLKNFHGIKK